MSIDGVNTSAGPAAVVERSSAAGRSAFDRLTVGQELTLTVLRRLGAREYLVAMGGEQHVVDSAVALEVGGQIRAGVTAVDERLTLRYLDSRAAQRGDEPREADLLGRLAERHGVVLAPHEHALLRAAAEESDDPARLILSGLYLTKLGMPLEPHSVHALYAAQIEIGARAAVRAGGTLDAGRAQQDDAEADSSERLAELLGDAFDSAAPAQSELGAAGGDPHGDPEREHLVQQALNLQDGGSVGYRYATLPLLIGGELTELQVALFTPHQADARGQRVRRLVMTLDTPKLREIRIEAKSVDERIVVAIDASAPAAVEALAAGEQAVRELLAELGWAVEAVSYGVNFPPDRAARRIVDHVLAAGTVDETF